MSNISPCCQLTLSFGTAHLVGHCLFSHTHTHTLLAKCWHRSSSADYNTKAKVRRKKMNWYIQWWQDDTWAQWIQYSTVNIEDELSPLSYVYIALPLAGLWETKWLWVKDWIDGWMNEYQQFVSFEYCVASSSCCLTDTFFGQIFDLLSFLL